MNDFGNERSNAIERLKGLLLRIDYHTQPFLYYLPQLLTKPELSQLNPDQAITFVQLAMRNEKSPLIQDAMRILNKIVDPENGNLRQPGRDIFYENRNFFWDELGNHTKATDIISHIFNKTIFHESMVGK
jgi:tetratricopeptide (TPR) repeat protein